MLELPSPPSLAIDAHQPRRRAAPAQPPPSKSNGRAKPDTLPPPSPRSFNGFSEITSFLWSVADLLRGDYKQADYGKVILPLTVIRRLDCVLEKTKAKVLAKHAELKTAKHPEGTIEKMLLRASANSFYNTSKLDFEKLKGDPNNVAANLTSYIKGFSPTARAPCACSMPSKNNSAWCQPISSRFDEPWRAARLPQPV